MAIPAGTFLLFPLLILSQQSSNRSHLITVTTFTLVFSLLLSRASDEQIMVTSAGYAAVLVVLLSNKSASKQKIQRHARRYQKADEWELGVRRK